MAYFGNLCNINGFGTMCILLASSWRSYFLYVCTHNCVMWVQWDKYTLKLLENEEAHAADCFALVVLRKEMSAGNIQLNNTWINTRGWYLVLSYNLIIIVNE